MAAGRTLVNYVPDLFFLPPNISIDEPNNLVAQPGFGWLAAVAGAPRSPRRHTPRHIIGRNAATGRRARAIVASTAADKWTGVETTWTSIQNDGTVLVYTITGYVGEKASL